MTLAIKGLTMRGMARADNAHGSILAGIVV